MKIALALILAFVSPLAFAAPPNPSIRDLIWYVVVIIGLGIVFGLLHYAIGAAPFINDAIKKAGQYLVILIGILIIIYVILSLIGL